MAATKRGASGVVVDRLECVRDVVSLFVSRGDLGLYPIGSRVRVTVERLP